VQKDWWPRRAPCHQKKATPEDANSSRSPSLTLPPSSFDTRLHDHLTLIICETVFVLFILIVILTIPSRSRDCFRIALPALLLARKQGLTRLILKHSNIPRNPTSTTPLSLPQCVDLAGTRRDYHRGSIRSILTVTSFSPFNLSAANLSHHYWATSCTLLQH
jgi:hypothetical protein